MKILVLGNGFDLAHGLPTTYSDFLDFCEFVEELPQNVDKLIFDGIAINHSLKENLSEMIFEKYISKNVIIKKIKTLLEHNCWYSYFKSARKALPGGLWIDFENEMKRIIKTIDEQHYSMDSRFINILNDPAFRNERNDGILFFLEQINYNKYDGMQSKDILLKHVRNIMYEDLQKLSKALDIYLACFVEKIDVENRKLDFIDKLDVGAVLTFNYTNTFERLYAKEDKKTEIFHIHGICNDDLSADSQIILGISKYASQEENVYTDFAIFKKYVQRIQNRINRNNYLWLAKAKETYMMLPTGARNEAESKLYFIGHSLTDADDDILRPLIEDECMNICVYSYSRADEGEKISNIIRMISEEKLSEKMYMNPNYAKISFEVKEEMAR